MEFNEKLVAIQSGLKAPKDKTASVKTKSGANYSYKFRSAETILADLKPLLVEHGLAISLSDEIIEIGTRLFNRSTVTLTDGESHFASTASAELLAADQMNSSQATGATISYSRKYALAGLLGIDDGDDADHERYQPSQQTSSQPTATTGASDKQINLIQIERNKLQASDPQGYELFKEWYKTQYEGKTLKELSKAEASTLIEKLKGE
jgi:hypothetical protein